MKKFTVLTLFPDMVRNVICSSITGRAIDQKLVGFDAVDIRDFATNKYRKVDDTIYGGGTGMLMMCQPVYDAWKHVVKEEGTCRTIYLSPKGRVFNQNIAKELSAEDNLIFLCGHYEGIDQRVIEEIVDDEISIGDYVLTGGEIAACVVIDSVMRLIPGVLPSEDAYTDESHNDYLLEYPQYTKPYEWEGVKVPEVLVSGHHKNISDWKRKMSLIETMNRRPDMFEKARITEDDIKNILAHLN